MRGLAVPSSFQSLFVACVAAVLAAACDETVSSAADAAVDMDESSARREAADSADRSDEPGIDLVEDAGSLTRAMASPRSVVSDEDAGAAGAGESKADSGAPKPAGEEPSQRTAQDPSEACVEYVMPDDCTTPQGRPLPAELRCTGLYGDWERRTAACGVTEYRPAYELWSDGARKRRWISLPQGQSIDASRPESFVYPVGTQFWKEFRIRVDGELRPAETRLLRKSDKGWLYTSYVWDEQSEHAIQTNEGVNDLFGTDHVVPTLEQCRQCHAGREDFILGWDPIMLGRGATGVSYEQLIERGVLQHASGPAPTIPGVDHDVLALGYLHANCGISCHNPQGDAKDSGLFMRLDTDKLQDLYTTPTLATGLYKVPWENAKIQTLTPPEDMPFTDIYFTRPDASLVLVRMQTRGSETQMPPIGTRRVDEQGVAWVRALIE